MTKEIKATLYLVLTAVIWGFAFVAQRIGSEFVRCFTYNGVRYLLGAVSLIPVIAVFEKETITATKLKKTFFASLITGAVLFAASCLQQKGIEVGQSAGKAGFITSLYIVLIPIFKIFLGKRANNLTWFGIIFAIVGLYLLTISDIEAINKGDVLVFVGSFFWATHMLLVDKFVSDISPLKYSFGQFFVCGCICIVCALFFETPNFSTIYYAAIPILYGGVMSVGIAYTFQVLGQRDLNPEFASLICSTEAVFSAIGGAIILGETMILRSYIGCVLIFVGIILAQFKKKKV